MQTAYDRVRRVIVQQAGDGRLARSVPELARLARLSDRSVQRALGALRDEGELELVRPARQHYPPEYDLAGTLAAEVSFRSVGAHLAAVPGATSAVTMSPLPGATQRGGQRGGAHTHKRARPPRRRRPLRADGTNPRAEAARAKERARPPGAYEVCEVHGIERNGLGLCSGCRSERLAAGGEGTR